MSTFKFNFSREDDESAVENAAPAVEDTPTAPAASEVSIESVIDCIGDTIFGRLSFKCEHLEIEYVHPDDAIKYLEDSGEKFDSGIEAEKSHSDLVEGKYEGGLKIWECTYDLAKYLLTDESISLKDTKVLDLGCGAGILGIIALLQGATLVDFQDYNREVIIGTTIPNVLLNLDDEKDEIKNKCRFFTGDWESLVDFLKDKADDDTLYDYILTCETIYNSKNYPKICSILENRLKNSGCAYVAAKSHYFGVGGSVNEFKKCIETTTGMKIENCWKNSDGLSREIIKIHFNNG